VSYEWTSSISSNPRADALDRHHYYWDRGQVLWAIFSQRVRNSIARHRLAHTLWLVASLFAILVLIACLYPYLANRPPRGANQRPAVDAGQSALFVFGDPRSGTSQVKRLGGLVICAKYDNFSWSH